MYLLNSGYFIFRVSELQALIATEEVCNYIGNFVNVVFQKKVFDVSVDRITLVNKKRHRIWDRKKLEELKSRGYRETYLKFHSLSSSKPGSDYHELIDLVKIKNRIDSFQNEKDLIKFLDSRIKNYNKWKRLEEIYFLSFNGDIITKYYKINYTFHSTSDVFCIYIKRKNDPKKIKEWCFGW